METENWLNKEIENLKSVAFDNEKLPALKLEENKVTTISIDVSKPFEKWVSQEDDTVKKLLPSMVNGQNYIWWLNQRNPLMSEIIRRGAKTYPNPLVIKVLQIGNKQNTRYTIVEE